MGAGCGGFSLIGLLVGVGLTVWLGSMVMDGTLGGDEAQPRDAETLASVIASTTTVPRRAAISVVPASDLTDGAVVTVTSDAFPAGSEVRVDTCLARSNMVTGDAPPCDPGGGALSVVDQQGHLATRYQVARVVTVGGTPFDCAGEPGLCIVAVTDTADTTRAGSVPVAFRADGHGPEITLPD